MTDVKNYFGKQIVAHLEQMFQSGRFDFSFRLLFGANIIHYAAMTGNLDRVIELVEHGADLFSVDNNCKTVLHYAAESGNVKLVQWLTSHGLDVKAIDRFKKSVLFYAAQSGNQMLVQWLVEQGADIYAKGQWDETIMHYTCQSGSLDLVQWLSECLTIYLLAKGTSSLRFNLPSY